ncbi:MAG: DUF2752 domain-containing protein [Bacteroidota bacterium]
MKVFFVTISFYQQAVQFMEKHMAACPSKKYLGMECPGCGLQRSLIALLKGEPVTSFKMYAATIPIILMLLFLLLHIKNKYAKGAAILQGFYLFCAAVIVAQYVYKIAGHQITIH